MTSKVVIVDDDIQILQSLKRLLGTAGYQVDVFVSAEQCLSERALEDIGCLISDIGLPRMSGLELLRIVRMQRYELPVILITAQDQQRQADFRAMGTCYVLHKPFLGSALLSTIRAVLGDPPG
jgi:DNA-binding response OmpR family regulator